MQINCVWLANKMIDSFICKPMIESAVAHAALCHLELRIQCQWAVACCSGCASYPIADLTSQVINNSDSHVAINAGNILAGFGKIAFRTPGVDNATAIDPEVDIAFSPKDSSEQIIIEPNLTTIGDEVTKVSKEKSADMAKVCYHEIVRQPGAESFTLKQTVSVVARSKDMSQQGVATGSSFGCYVPLKVWTPSDDATPADGQWYKIIWACKWGPNGLMPVRPLIVVTCQLEIPGGHAIAI